MTPRELFELHQVEVIPQLSALCDNLQLRRDEIGKRGDPEALHTRRLDQQARRFAAGIRVQELDLVLRVDTVECVSLC